MENVLNVSLEKISEEYTPQRLGKIFRSFGAVEDVVIRSFKKKESALVVMASKDAAISLFSSSSIQVDVC